MQPKDVMFESPAIPNTRVIAWLKRACLIVVNVYRVIGAIAAYRALVQVHSFEIESADVLQPGSKVNAMVVSYARVPLDVRIELVQDGHSETVAVYRLPKNEWSLLDPRLRESYQTVFLNGDMLNRFAEGEAIVRATVIRRQQLGRHPPPVVRERVVNIAAN